MTQVFPVNFAKFLRTAFLQNTSGGCFWNDKLPTILEYSNKVFKAVNYRGMCVTAFFIYNEMFRIVGREF